MSTEACGVGVVGAYKLESLALIENIVALGETTRLGRRLVLGIALEEERHRHIKCLAQLPQARGRHAVRSSLILLNLLEFDSDLLSKLLLSHAFEPSKLFNPLADVDIHGMGLAGDLFGVCFFLGHR